MLVELHIENLGVIERASLVFPAGLTALTGETGAGKTMLVEAIELLVGGRADAAIVRRGAAEARVDGRLVSAAGDDEVVLTRVIPADGRSRAYVNGRPATVAHLAELAAGTIDLHGQHAHQSLLAPATQRAALDTWAGVDLEPLRIARAKLTELDAELATLGGDERARAREIDLLRFQVAELDASAIHDPAEDGTLATEESTLSDAVAHRQAGAEAVEALRGEGAVSDGVGVALSRLADRAPYASVAGRLAGVAAELDDIAAELRELAESIEEDPERLTDIRLRRQLLVDLRRKYGADLAEVMEYHADAEHRLRELEHYERRAGQLDSLRADAAVELDAAAAAIAAVRSAAAPRLAADVQRHLRALAMPDAEIAIDVAGQAGDEVRFSLSANPGTALGPLNKVASGGELARAMLALRLVLSGAGDHAGAATLVFDEVDAGIGGSAAVAVGAALAALGEHHQVLVVTHLPQVAAHAAGHLVVNKSVVAGATFTEVAEVVGEARVGEIARMLAGDDTAAARAHAAELLGTTVT